MPGIWRPPIGITIEFRFVWQRVWPGSAISRYRTHVIGGWVCLPSGSRLSLVWGNSDLKNRVIFAWRWGNILISDFQTDILTATRQRDMVPCFAASRVILPADPLANDIIYRSIQRIHVCHWLLFCYSTQSGYIYPLDYHWRAWSSIPFTYICFQPGLIPPVSICPPTPKSYNTII